MQRSIAFALPVLALGLAGCAGTGAIQAYQDAVRIPAGSVLTLHRTLELPGAGDFLYLQGGHSLRLRDVQRLEPHCYLETRSVPTPGYPVAPNRFTVTRLTRDTFYAGRHDPGGYLKVNADGGGSPSSWYFITHLWLQPETATDVFRLTCQVDRLTVSAPPLDRTHLTVDEVRQALGDTFTLELAEGADGASHSAAVNRAMDSTWLVWGNMSMTPAATSR